jgi:phosphate starvation-inducible PhoH-like protein
MVPNSLLEERHLQRRLKRSNRANPREDRNIFDNKNVRNNIIELEQFTKHLKQKVELIPKNLSQETYIEKLEDPNINIVFAIGPAGTGKSYLGTLYAIQCLKNGSVSKIVITRPNISLDDKDIGFLPGDIFAKMAPWTRPILEIFEELLPMAFIRGRTLKNSIILLDEAQNTTKLSMVSALTRIGENSKMIVTGDTKQSDRGTSNGLTDFLQRYKPNKRVAVVEFQQQDVERHPVINTILDWYGEN